MPQQTNLNVSPYFDDFDANNDYHKVLFKPSYPIQARELNNLQSILQNQVEKFGQHFFKEGAKVIPGNTAYNKRYYGIQLNNNYKGIPVSAYVDQLVGTKITGQSSGVTAVVSQVLLPEDSERDTLTLYVNYIQSSTTNNLTQTFSDAEGLSCNQDITSGLLSNSVITAGAPFATTVSNNAAVIGSSFTILEGVYFIRGNFVNVSEETLILDQYTNLPSYRVGLYVDEQVITADQDETLNDNSQGYNNYAASGADRLKITTSLYKKPLTDFDDNNFVELTTAVNGNLEPPTTSKLVGGGGAFSYDITDTLARRTFDESGDYQVKPFNIVLLNSLNDNVGNRGVWQSGQFTYSGSTPSRNLAVYKISPGKAYVKGYEVETTNTYFLDVDKPRTTKVLEDQSIIYNTGPTVKLNSIYRSPTIGIGNTYYVSLRNQRVGVADTYSGSDGAQDAKEIGVARIYDYRLESGSYDTTNGNRNEWDISLYDIQTYSTLTLNQADTLTIPCFVEGENSGATGFLRYSVNAGTAVTVYDKAGSFITNEKLTFNGIAGGRIAIAVTSNSISDVKSLYGTNDGISGINTFHANVIQSPKWEVGIASITVPSGSPSISTVRSTVFSNWGTGVIKENDLIQYTDTTLASPDPVMARVTYVGNGTDIPSSRIEVVGVATVTGIVEGALPSSQLQVTDLTVLTTDLDKSEDNTLYTVLPKPNVSDVDFTSASITIRKTYSVDIASNEITSSSRPTAGTNETFLPFDVERYTLIRSDGSTEELTSDKVTFNSTATEFGASNLGSADSGATLIATLKKVKPTSKKKIRNRVNSLVISKSKDSASGIGSTTLNDGLDFGDGYFPYGTRVQDKTLSLNTPDIIEIHGIYESSDTSDPSAPKATLSSINSSTTTTSELTIGELLIGQTSGAVAACAERVSNDQISYVKKNQLNFTEGETVIFQESRISAVVSALDAPSFDISKKYTFSAGQKKTFYNYGTLKRKADFVAPEKRLKIYFESGYYDSTDEGDLTSVDSYNTFNFSNEIQSIDGHRNTDIFDIRPRVSDYTVTESSRSPLEFLGRSFNGAGNSAANILASDENIITDISYYLGRVDRIYVSKSGKFQVVYGTPAENPQLPNPIDGAIELATVTLPPYLYTPEDANISFLEYKRFRMVDIKNLENRIKNLEFYTALSLLEVETANMFIPDGDGLNRFKAGFFVDNFSSFRTQSDSTIPQNAIDMKNKICRPMHYTNAVDLMLGPVVNQDQTADQQFSLIQGTNVRKSNDIITLDYSEEVYIEQPFATRSESVTPFLMSFWTGSLELNPASDTWVSTTRIEDRIIEVQGDFEDTMRQAVQNEGVDPQTGFAPTVWNAWETNWVGTEVVNTTRNVDRTWTTGNWRAGNTWRQTWQEELEETRRTGFDVRTGTTTIITEQWDNTSVGDRVVSRALIAWMRARNIEFTAKSIKPLTRMYAFFDGEDITAYCVPKLLEISMDSGTFQVGEKVRGSVQPIGLADPIDPDVGAAIEFRVAQCNHREGPYNAPTVTYPLNPYTNSVLPFSYSSTSNILNVDTFSLASEVQGEYSGWLSAGMTLRGETSGATCTVNTVRLVSDIAAGLIGCYYNPNPDIATHLRFETGTKSFTLINDEQNDVDSATTLADETFTSSGTMETVQENIVSVRNARRETRISEEQSATFETVSTRVTGSSAIGDAVVTNSWQRNGDPLAQSFRVDPADSEGGLFVTKVDLFFRTVDDLDVPVKVQLRTMINGTPTEKIIPQSEIVLSPDDITISADGSKATTVEFKSPVYLTSGTWYALVLISNSTKYSVYISRVGENDLESQVFVQNQPVLGSLFKSQNGSTWDPSQWEDLKFTLYKATFESSGVVDFYNPELTKGNNQVPTLMPDSLSLISRKVRVGLGTTVADAYEMGNVFFQQGTNATGHLVGVAGSATGSLAVSNPGIGYTPTDGGVTFAGVNLVTLTGNGRGATAEVTIANGVAAAATITGNGGYGYEVGDVLGITTIGIASLGRNSKFTITGIGITNELIFENVQGNFVVGSANTVMFINSSGITTELNSSGATGLGTGGDVQISTINVDSDGTHIKVNHKNHGMYFDDNIVEISGALSDVKPTKLSLPYSSGSTGNLSVDDATSFSTFENVGVGTTNVGFLRIADEIIQYTNVSGNNIGGNITRGTGSLDYPTGTPVYKYELGGVNLKRINGIHTLSDATVSEPITFDSYHIKVDMSQTFNTNNDNRGNDVGFPALYLNGTQSGGGSNIKATQNMPYEIITPIVHNVTSPGTSLIGEVRTVTSQSIDGTEIPYLDNGFEGIALNSPNYLDSPRLIASKVNADAKLTNLEGSKSLNMRLFLGTTDSNLSPVIDAQRVSTILTSNRVNNVVTNYATDKRVNSLDDDPTACQYISKEIALENSATSIKIMVSAHIDVGAGIRAFYAIGDGEGFDPIFTPFPGFNNLNNRGQILAAEDSDGQSDVFVPKSNDLSALPTKYMVAGVEPFKEYTFTADQLPSFRSYKIKILLTSTSQVYVPVMKQLRVMALA